MMNWKTASASHIGGRKEQQDRIAVFSCAQRKALLMVVADGMGGHNEGALAAQTVIETCERKFHDIGKGDPIHQLNQIILEAHARIQKIHYGKGRAPGSTAVLLYIAGNKAYWAHVGDSRLYHLRDLVLHQRTLDHSMAQLLVNEGALDASQIGNSPLQNQLTMCVGGEQVPQSEFGHCTIKDGDCFLLCSDGLWANVSTEEMIQTMTKHRPAAAVDRLGKNATSNGGPKSDNISLAMVRIESTRLSPFSRMLNRLSGVKENAA